MRGTENGMGNDHGVERGREAQVCERARERKRKSERMSGRLREGRGGGKSESEKRTERPRVRERGRRREPARLAFLGVRSGALVSVCRSDVTDVRSAAVARFHVGARAPDLCSVRSLCDHCRSKVYACIAAAVDHRGDSHQQRSGENRLAIPPRRFAANFSAVTRPPVT